MRFFSIILAFYIFLVSFAPNMQGIQLFNVGALITHYEAHQQSPEQFNSFFDYLTDHYFKNHPTKDNERHLPFKSIVSVSGVPFYVPVSSTLLTLSVSVPETTQASFHYQHNSLTRQSFSVWNPPKHDHSRS